MVDSTPKPKSKLEPHAFQFCKIATFCLIFQRYALPAAALLAASLYFLGYARGERDTRCWLRHYLLIGGLWAVVLAGWLFLEIRRYLAI